MGEERKIRREGQFSDKKAKGKPLKKSKAKHSHLRSTRRGKCFAKKQKEERLATSCTLRYLLKSNVPRSKVQARKKTVS